MFTEYRKVISGLSGRTTYDQRTGCRADNHLPGGDGAGNGG